jgi:hypothetical protein
VPDDARIPGASTIRHWAAAEGWAAWAGEKAPPLPGQNLRQWTTMWRRHVVRQVEAALQVQNAVLTGRFDGDYSAADASLATADASMTHLLAQPGVRALLRVAFSGEDAPSLPLPERERHVRRRLLQRRNRPN